MKRSVSTSSQTVVSGASKRNASEEATVEVSPQVTSLPPISKSPAEHEYEQNIVTKTNSTTHLKKR